MTIRTLTQRLRLTGLLAAVTLTLSACGARNATYVEAPKRPPQIEHPGPGETRFYMDFQGWERTYLLYLPPSYVPGTPLPLVIMFHGAGGKAKNTNRQTGWEKKAEQEGFAVVLPDGTPEFKSLPPKFLANPQTWNDGGGKGPAAKNGENDVAFTEAIIDEVGRKATIDLNRIYVSGFSNGASMAFRVAAELSVRIAAAAPVAGHYRLKGYTPSRSVPLLYIVGSDDPLTPMDGGEVSLPWGSSITQPAVAETVRSWTRLMGCDREPNTVEENGPVKLSRYRPCRGGGEMEYYLIAGMGHVWPGGDPMLPDWVVGQPSDALNATDVIWEFFKRHELEPGAAPSWMPHEPQPPAQ